MDEPGGFSLAWNGVKGVKGEWVEARDLVTGSKRLIGERSPLAVWSGPPLPLAASVCCLEMEGWMRWREGIHGKCNASDQGKRTMGVPSAFGSWVLGLGSAPSKVH